MSSRWSERRGDAAFSLTLTEAPECVHVVHVLLGCGLGEKQGAYPGLDLIAMRTGLANSTVRAYLTRLASKGVIEDTGRRVGRTGRVKVWKFGPEVIRRERASREPDYKRQQRRPLSRRLRNPAKVAAGECPVVEDRPLPDWAEVPREVVEEVEVSG